MNRVLLLWRGWKASSAFTNCGKLDDVVLLDVLAAQTSIDVPAGVASVGNAAFRGCTARRRLGRARSRGAHR